MVTNWD